MTWPILAPMGSCRRSSLRTCVDFSVEPSDIVTVTGFVAGVTLVVEGATLEIGFFAARWNKKTSARRRWNFFLIHKIGGCPPKK